MLPQLTACYQKIKHSWKIAFCSTFIIGLLIHIYKFTNTLPNFDSLLNFYRDQNIVYIGRWFLCIACGFSSFFDLPWINGLFSLILIALTAVVIVDIFRMEDPVLIVLTGGLLAAFPSITQTFAYEFTADGYMLAMLLAALAVRFSRIGDRSLRHLFLAACCVCFSCAIYQAYVSFALMLALCYFLTELFENKYSKKEYLLWIRNQIILYIAALLAYYIIWQICLKVEGFTVTSYQGADKIGQMNIHSINNAIYESVRHFLSFFFVRDIFKYGLSPYIVFNILFIIAALTIGITAVIKSGLYKRKWQLVLLLLCVAAIPFIAYMWYFSSPSVTYYSIMEQSLCVLYIFIGILFCRWAKPKAKDLVAVLFALIIFNNGINANIFYYHMDKCYERSYAIAVEMATRIHMINDSNVKSIAVIGEMPNYMDTDYYAPSKFGNLWSGISISHILMPYEHLVQRFLSGILDYHFQTISSEEKADLAQSTEVSEMSCWPAPDSIRIIDNVIVIKGSEPDDNA